MSQPRSNDGRRRLQLGGMIPAAWAFALLALGAGGSRADDTGGELKYNRDIRPILSENCFACHGPDSGSRKANLRLDRRESAMEADVLAPGDAETSELVARIASADPMEVMPPPGAHKTLTAEQKDVLRRWVAQGAEYQPHWSFLAPTRPEPPAVSDSAWSRNPIDRFVLAGLEAKGLKPAPEADRRTLARRLSLDLTGLPPAPAEVDAFVSDQAPDAYERHVERLMASPRWGEHRARYWLDAARYADTHGIHIDNYREIWAYRRWVIDAFNANMPFDRFTIEQLAGDLLPDRTLDQQIASGFNRCNITTSEGGAIAEEYAVLYTRERTETVSQVWMGLTTGCAVCHDHKFDPFSQREFYELSAFFNNTTQAAMDGNVKDTPPIVFVAEAADRARVAPLTAELADAKKALADRKPAARPEFDGWLAAATPETLGPMIPTEALKLHAFAGERSPEAKASRAVLEVAESGDFEKDKPFTAGAWIRARSSPGWTTCTAIAAGTSGWKGARSGRTSSTTGPPTR